MGYGLTDWNDTRPPSARAISEQNNSMRVRQEHFRTAARYVAAAFSSLPHVQRVALFGSVAAPLAEEIPRFRRFRTHRVAVLHECKDVDLAVWVDDLNCLKALQRARGQALNHLYAEREIGVAHHQVDIFIIDADTGGYLGNLCSFGTCPKGKEDCYVPGCGATPYLKIYEDFALHEDALSSGKAVVLCERREGGERELHLDP